MYFFRKKEEEFYIYEWMDVHISCFTPRKESCALLELLHQEAVVNAHQMEGADHSEKAATGCLFLRIQSGPFQLDNFHTIGPLLHHLALAELGL